ncbi:MAG: formylglycine-generating enzyme family protein [Myxococcota bacterium]
MGSPEDEPGHNDEEAQRDVWIERPFLIQTRPVTQAQWTELMGDTRFHSVGPRRPVESITWWEAATYCNTLSRQEGLPEVYTLEPIEPLYSYGERRSRSNTIRMRVVALDTDSKGYRLPSEAQWEYACRAGTTEATYGGNLDPYAAWNTHDPCLDAIAWYRANSEGHTQDVGQKQPNRWGLYDMLGNVWEWTEDVYIPDLQQPYAEILHNNRRTAPDPLRVIRGGSWLVGYGFNLRSAARAMAPSGEARHDIGFRCLRLV